jgi:hypothetical protein
VLQHGLCSCSVGLEVDAPHGAARTATEIHGFDHLDESCESAAGEVADAPMQVPD